MCNQCKLPVFCVFTQGKVVRNRAEVVAIQPHKHRTLSCETSPTYLHLLSNYLLLSLPSLPVPSFAPQYTLFLSLLSLSFIWPLSSLPSLPPSPPLTGVEVIARLAEAALHGGALSAVEGPARRDGVEGRLHYHEGAQGLVGRRRLPKNGLAKGRGRGRGRGSERERGRERERAREREREEGAQGRH